MSKQPKGLTPGQAPTGAVNSNPSARPDELQRLQKAREAGGELSEQAPESEKKETAEPAKEGETKPKHTHVHKH